ncbi:male sterility domain-containing protein [Cladochytrium replicatum]|nr:male sterility domain-containing protein [Cladochytrium replicatum]
MAIAVGAATGLLGKLIVQYLAANGLPVIALARNPENTDTPGVEKRLFDYGSPSPNSRWRKIYLLHVDLEGGHYPLVLAADHKATEEYLEEAGIPFTALRNGWYLDNWLGMVDSILASGSIFESTHGAKLSPASRAYAGESVKKYYELGGEAITLDELAAEISAKAGKPVKYVDLAQADYAKILERFGFTAGRAFVFSQASEAASEGGLFTDSKDLEEALGRAPENWRDVVNRFVKGTAQQTDLEKAVLIFK